MDTPTALRELLRAHRLRLTKRLGQNFLVDARTAARLLEDCHLTPRDTVVEIGAGLGALTERLAEAAGRVIAVEVDRKIGGLLTERLADRPNVEVAAQDILTFPWARYPGSKVVGMIPYRITSPILVSLCEHAADVRGAWLGMQREVAQRLAASCGTKAYGRLTILVQCRFDVEELRRIPRSVFFPQPNVDSSWVQLIPKRPPAVPAEDERMFFAVVQAAFAQRRKTLLNCLERAEGLRLTKTGAAEALQRAGLPARVRGEALSLAQFAALSRAIAQTRE